MKILIIEDEYYNFTHLSSILKHIDGSMEVEGPLMSVEEVVDYFKSALDFPDLIISDIRLGDGLVFEGFKQVNVITPIIFTTAYDDYALSAFKYNSIDYLLKPVQEEHLKQALYKYRNMANVLPVELSKIEQVVQQKYRSRILCLHNNNTVVVPVKEVAYISMEDSLVKVYLKDGSSHYTINLSLTELETKLNPNAFFRANRQEIVNISEITGYQTEPGRKALLRVKAYPHKSIAVSKERFLTLKRLLAK